MIKIQCRNANIYWHSIKDKKEKRKWKKDNAKLFLEHKYIYVWGFNSSSFDNHILLPWLVQRDNVIQSFGEMSRHKFITYGHNVKFVDIILLLPIGSLKRQCEIWNLKNRKSEINFAVFNWEKI